MANLTKPQHLFKKYRITIISALAFAVALCCILAFAGNNSETLEEPIVQQPSEYAAPESGVSESEISENEKLFGYGLYVDGSFVATVYNKTVAENALSEILSDRVSSLGISSESENSFNNKIELIEGEYVSESFVEAEVLLSLLGKNNTNTVLSNIRDYNGNSVSAKLTVRSVTTFTETVTLEYDIKTIYTDFLREGVEKVITKGYNGEGEETYQLIALDGVVSEKETLNIDVKVAPTDEIVRIGVSTDRKDVASFGTFKKPFDGVITSHFGPRWGRTHKGIDIAGNDCNGKPALAAAVGVVVRADWFGGYGNCVIIDHGNGVRTLYAHMSELSVEVGQHLNAGDEVGKIGSTGNSTGPHLHFEVYVDDELVNPLIFVDYE